MNTRNSRAWLDLAQMTGYKAGLRVAPKKAPYAYCAIKSVEWMLGYEAARAFVEKYAAAYAVQSRNDSTARAGQ